MNIATGSGTQADTCRYAAGQLVQAAVAILSVLTIVFIVMRFSGDPTCCWSRKVRRNRPLTRFARARLTSRSSCSIFSI